MRSKKMAEVSNTHAMPANETTDLKTVRRAKDTAMKTAEEVLEEAFGIKEAAGTCEDPTLKPHVDVAGKEAPKEAREKKAEHYALPSIEHYPLDNYAHVKQAAAYFDQWGSQLAPEYRREYCLNLVKRASALGIEVSEEIRQYGAETYAPIDHLKIAMAGRKLVISNENHTEVLDKLAQIQPQVSPDMFCALLSEFDKEAGIVHLYDHDVLDPYRSVYGQKTAESLGQSPNSALVVGNDYISVDDLKKFSVTRQVTVKQVFGEELAEEFRKDPVGIFNSLPSDQKKMLIRMATDNAPRDTVSG